MAGQGAEDMEITEGLLKELKKALRVKSSAADSKVRGLVEACLMELRIAGVYARSLEDPLCRQAATLYCKAHYGYDDKAEPFLEAYKALRDAMALSGDYKEKEGVQA